MIYEDNQIMFDRMVEHLASMKQPSTGSYQYKQISKYRGIKGNKCVIGCLIPDEEYRRRFETVSILGVINQNVRIKNIFKRTDPDLLYDMQAIHDKASNWDLKKKQFDGKGYLYNIALRYRLNVTTLKKYFPVDRLERDYV